MQYANGKTRTFPTERVDRRRDRGSSARPHPARRDRERDRGGPSPART